MERKLNFFDVFSIATGAMISSGIFVLPAMAYGHTGSALFISYLIGGIIALIGILSIAELSSAMPKAGGDYYFISRSFGPLMGTINGFLSWFALSLKSAFAIYGLSGVVYLLTGISMPLTALAATIFFVLLNIVGVKEAALLELVLVAFLISIMIAFIFMGFPIINRTHFVPLAPMGINSIFSTAAFVFISFGGLLKIASVAEEVKNPGKNIPLGMLVSVIFVTVLYVLMIFVTTGILKPDDFKSSILPISDAALIFAGRPGFVAITIASFLAFITTANAGIMAASRYPLALSRDNLIPGGISRVSKRFNTPVVSILVTGVFIILALQIELEILVKSASSVILIAYILSNISVIILRESKLSNYRPVFKVPLYPYIPILSIAMYLFLLVDLGMEAIEISLVFIVISILVYLFYGRKRAKKEFALLYLLKRIVDSRMPQHGLETELREVLRHREGILDDNFDRMVKDSVVLDLKGHFVLDDFLKKISIPLGVDLGIESKEIFRLLKNRENDSSTAISSFVSIPHIILEKTEVLHMMIVRCRDGVTFSETEKSVKAIFLIVGNEGERVLHLRLLASIATLVQENGFEDKWLNAKDVNYLRDMILLSSRNLFPKSGK
ncbi:MAG: amino acid permease [Spirochaetia bacterium]|jgi:APA family basic amino acid/polyamine antiporter|nr:amino acid permease [Spirochaetia bacterium]